MVAAFAVLTLLVEIGATRLVDVAARDFFRPDDVWGPVQIRVDTVVEGLEPARVLPVYAALVTLLAWSRRSWRPMVHALALLAAAGLPALLVKRTMARTDPHGDLSSIGSFPSGHVLVLLVCLAGAVLLVRQEPRWWQWALVAMVDLAMAGSLLLQAAHWLTDVVGGALLGVAALASTAHLLARAPDGTGRRAGRPPRARGAAASPSC